MSEKPTETSPTKKAPAAAKKAPAVAKKAPAATKKAPVAAKKAPAAAKKAPAAKKITPVAAPVEAALADKPSPKRLAPAAKAAAAKKAAAAQRAGGPSAPPSEERPPEIAPVPASKRPEAAPAPPDAEAAPHRAGFVALVGRPNVGKSTLLNQLVGERVAITTPKPQTTRDRIRGIRTFSDWQAVYVDTPGIHEASTLLNRYMVELAIGTLGDADLVYLLVDGAHLVAKPDDVMAETAEIVARIRAAGSPCVLVINKVDRIGDKARLLPYLQALGELHSFVAVVPLSARTGDGVDRLHDLTRARLPESPQLFPEDSLTDRSMRFLAAEMIREQLFHRLSQELPYQIAVTTDAWEEREDGLVVVYATVHVARDGHKGIVIGKGGERLKAVGRASRLALERFSERRVFLDLRVRVEERWNEREFGLKKLGYNES